MISKPISYQVHGATPLANNATFNFRTQIGHLCVILKLEPQITAVALANELVKVCSSEESQR